MRNDAYAVGDATEAGPTAGDLYLRSVEAWMAHMDEPHDPAVDVCDTCEMRMGLVKVARNVWQNSRHQAVSR